jgi:hypothetical protein
MAMHVHCRVNLKITLNLRWTYDGGLSVKCGLEPRSAFFAPFGHRPLIDCQSSWWFSQFVTAAVGSKYEPS